jgi:hypothetical protein
MHNITSIVTHFSAASPQSAGSSSPVPTGSGFQSALAARPGSIPAPPPSISTTLFPSLGSQAVSFLLQTQDLSQTQAHGHGGGHHGAKMTSDVEADEVAGETEEAQQLTQRKKPEKTARTSETSETVEVDENGVPLTDESEETSAGRSNDKSRRDSQLANG